MCNSYFQNIVPFKDNVGKYDTAGQATDYNIIRRIHCIDSKTHTTHTDYEKIIVFFQGGKWLTDRASTFRLFASLV
jgi:hypothetical protein